MVVASVRTAGGAVNMVFALRKERLATYWTLAVANGSLAYIHNVQSGSDQAVFDDVTLPEHRNYLGVRLGAA